MRKSIRKSKKIAIFADGEFIPSFSGATNRFHYLSRALQYYTNTEVIIILCDRGWSDIEKIKDEPFKTYLVHPSLYKNIDLLTDILRAENVDLIQFANLESAIEVGIQLSNNLNRHLIFEAHYDDYEFAKAIKAKGPALNKITHMQNTYGKYFDKVVALSNEDFKLSRNLKISKKGIAIIPSGVNLKEFPINCFNYLSKKIIFFGNLYFDVNLRAVKEIKKSMYGELIKIGFNFSIIGDISQLEKNKLIDKKFHILGKQNDLFKYMNKSIIALAPVVSGSGIRIKILNYLNAGIPVITTTHGARGFSRKNLLIIENDFKKYPLLIKRLVNDRKKIVNLSIQGRKFVRKNMSWRIVSELVSKEYDQLLKKSVLRKENAIRKILKGKFEDPAWIKEVISKKRFKRNLPFVKSGQYIIISKR